MKTYRDIAEEIAINIKAEREMERKLPQIIEAISYAEEKLIGKSRAVKFFERLTIDSAHAKFFLPSDFSTGNKIIITDRSLSRYRTKELEFESLADYDSSPISQSLQSSDLAVNPDLVQNTSAQTEQDAMYSGFVLYAMYKTANGWELAIKPPMDGYVFIYYASQPSVPTDIELRGPDVMRRFFHAIVSGATYYLLRRVSITLAAEDANKSVVMLRIASEYNNDFLSDIKDLTALTEDRIEPPIMKPFNMYGSPEDDV